MHFVEDLSRGILGKPDPLEIWEDIISNIPDGVLGYRGQNFLFPAFGHGTEVKVMIKRLQSLGWTKSQIIEHFYLCDKYCPFTNKAKSMGFKNVHIGDFLEWDRDMKFDVVIGNPPYQRGTGGRGKGQTLWDLFVIKSESILKDDGYLSMIHPSGWRNVGGSFYQVGNILRSMDLLYLSINNITQGQKTFGVSSRYDVYVGKKSNTKNFLTKIKCEQNKSYEMNLKDLSFIPNFNFEIFEHLLAKPNQETVEVLYNRSMYGADKKHMSKEKNEVYSWPCVKYISKKNNKVDLRYSDKNIGMFGIPKVMFGIGSNVGEIFIDNKGEYGMCAFTAGIVDKPEILPLIRKALKSEKFINLMESVQFSTQQYNHRIIGLLRKDFWKDFI